MATINPNSFTATTPTTIINQFLTELVSIPGNTFKIFPQVVSYTHKLNKQSVINTAPDEDKSSYEACAPITKLYKFLNSTSGTLIFFTGNIVPATEAASTNNSWHSFIVLYKDQQVFIYDPDYIKPNTPQNRHINIIPKLKLARSFLEIITTSKKKVLWNIRIGSDRTSYKGWGRNVRRVFVGGGGNLGTDCNKISWEWAKKFVEGGCNLMDYEKWEELKISTLSGE